MTEHEMDKLIRLIRLKNKQKRNVKVLLKKDKDGFRTK